MIQNTTTTCPQTDFVLQFGKYKGQKFSATPVSYQNWLLEQDWFKMPKAKPSGIVAYGVYYVPTKEGRLFAGIDRELIAVFDEQTQAISYCKSVNMGGKLDELHIGYSVYPMSYVPNGFTVTK
jgi:hypothetical protein